MKDHSEILTAVWDKKREAFFASDPRCEECRKPIIDNFALKGKCRICLRRSNGKAFREKHPDYYKNYEKGAYVLRDTERINPFLDKKLPTYGVIKEKAKRIRKTYMKRYHTGRRPNDDLFLLYALYLLFKEGKFDKIGSLRMFFQCFDFKELGYNRHWEEPQFYLEKIYKWHSSPAFKEMRYQQSWDDIEVSYNISQSILHADEKEMSPREIQRAYHVSKYWLRNHGGLILTVNRRLHFHRISKKFISS